MEDVLWKLTEDVAAAFPRLQTAIKALVSFMQAKLYLTYRMHYCLLKPEISRACMHI